MSKKKSTKKQTSKKQTTKKQTKAKAASVNAKGEKKTTKMKTTSKATTPGKASDGKPKRLSAIDAAAEVLKKSREPMRARELITAMEAQGLWTSPGGKTPHATLYAAMLREERDKGTASRFRKVERGLFGFNG